MANAFDELLESIGEDSDRKALGELARRYPEIRDGRLRQAEFSRKMDEFKPRLEYATSWEKWAEGNWDAEAGMTRAEAAQARTIAELQAALAKGSEGDQMTFEQLQEHIGKTIAERKIVTADQMAEHLRPVNENLQQHAAAFSTLMTKTIPLVMQHQQEYGEILDLDAMFEAANKAKITDLSAAYAHFTAEKKAAKDKAAFEEATRSAYEKGKSEGRTERIMGETPMPVDMSGPGMGHLERRLFQQQTDEEKQQNPVPEGVDLGGGIARFAAAAYRKQQAEKLSQ